MTPYARGHAARGDGVLEGGAVDPTGVFTSRVPTCMPPSMLWADLNHNSTTGSFSRDPTQMCARLPPVSAPSGKGGSMSAGEGRC